LIYKFFLFSNNSSSLAQLSILSQDLSKSSSLSSHFFDHEKELIKSGNERLAQF